MSADDRSPAGEASPTPPVPRETLLMRIGDRLNPILVREVHQALNGKAFLFTASLALLAIVIVALVVASEHEISPRQGGDYFEAALTVLIPILFFIVPFQAFLSTRSEVGGGTVEHLLMSRLSPGGIVRGKLMAAVIQFVIYLAIFAPLIAMTFLLRGVDVPTILVSLILLFVFALGCSAVAVSCGAMCRWRAFFRVVPFAIVLLGLGGFTAAAMTGVEEVVRNLRVAFAAEAGMHYLSLFLVPCAGAIVMCALVGSAMLAHPYENRSTPFRVFAVGCVVAAVATVLYEDHHLLMTHAPWRPTLGAMLAGALGTATLVGSLIPFFAATETPRLTPRVATRVPRNALLALLATPFLPGAGRGMLFGLLLAGLTLCSLYLVPYLWGGVPATHEHFAVLQGIWLYILLLSFLGALVRRSLGPQANRTWFARATLPAFLFVGIVVPLAWSAAGGTISLQDWSPMLVFNPVLTLQVLTRYGSANRDEILLTLLALNAILLVVNVGLIARGIAEVQAASAARRQHAS